MSRSNVAQKQILTAQSLSANFTSPVSTPETQDNIGYQINVTTTDSAGTFTVQGSLDNVNWSDLTLSGTPSVNKANDTILININQFPFNYIRLSYTSTVAGTGTCDVFVKLKGLGA